MNELKYFVLFELKLVDATFSVALVFLLLLYIYLSYNYYYFSKFLRSFVFITVRRFSLSFCGRLEFFFFNSTFETFDRSIHNYGRNIV